MRGDNNQSLVVDYNADLADNNQEHMNIDQKI